jgi:hypothetical protein
VSVTGSGSLAARRMRQHSLYVGGDANVSLAPALFGPNPPPGPSTHRLRSLAFEQAGNVVHGKLNLGNSFLIVDYSGASPAASIRQYLASGYAGGQWTGSGINSEAAALNQGARTALGWAEASDVLGPSGGLFGDLAVDGTSLLVRYTFYGDANLDGVVTLADFNRMASNFGGSNKAWSQGDFNFDGSVNLQDFNRLAGNFGLSAAGAGGPTPEDWSNLASAIPEPGGLPVLGLWAVAASLRLRRSDLRS